MENSHSSPKTHESRLPPALFTFLAADDEPAQTTSSYYPTIRFPALPHPAPVLDAGARQNLIEHARWQRAVLAAPFTPRLQPSSSSSTSASTSPPNLTFTPTSSSPASPARPPPGFDFAFALPDSSTAICTNRFPVTKRHYRILELRSVNARCTDYFLCDSLNGGLFHGTAPWGIEHFNFAIKGGMEVGDFMIANEPMRPVAADFFFPRFESRCMTRFIGAVGTSVHTSRENMLEQKEFMAKSYAYNERLTGKITIFERLPPHQHVARYLGVVVRTFGGVERVEALAFERFKVSLFSFASTPGCLQRKDVSSIVNAVGEALNHLHAYGIVHGTVSSCNVFLTYDTRKVGNKTECNVTNVVLGGFDKAVCVVGRRDFKQLMERDSLSLGAIGGWLMDVTS